MEDKLEKLINIDGVEAIFIFNNKAETIYHMLKRTLDDRLIEEIGRHILQLYALNKRLKMDDIDNMDVVFDKGTLISHKEDYYTIVIWLNKNAQASLIRLNLDLLISNLKTDSKFKKIVKKNKIDYDYLLQKEYLDEQDSLILEQLGIIK